MAKDKTDPVAAQPDGNGASLDPMTQVRELLFGESKRSTEEHLQAIEDRIEAMRADFLDRFSTLESRFVDLAKDTERNQAASVDAIGGAIAQLGASIQNMNSRRKGG